MSRPILTPAQRTDLRTALGGRLLILCLGGGVDSAAMLVALYAAGLRPDLILFADTGAEKRATYAYLAALAPVLARWGWPPVTWVKYRPGAKTGYTDLYSSCIKLGILPSLAYGWKTWSSYGDSSS